MHAALAGAMSNENREKKVQLQSRLCEDIVNCEDEVVEKNNLRL